MGGSRTGEPGPTSPATIPTGSVSTPTVPSGTPMSVTSLRARQRRRQLLQTIELDRGCFACMLGGEDGRTLFMVAQEWGGPANMHGGERTGQVLSAQGPASRD